MTAGYRLFMSKNLALKKALILIFIISLGLILLRSRSQRLPLHKYISSYINSDDLNSEYASISLCILIRVHRGHLSYLPVLALGLNHTGFSNIHLYIINIDKDLDDQLLLRTINMISRMVFRANYVTLLDVGKSKRNDFGFTLTDRALTYLYDRYEQSPSTCQYIIMTNGDNFYSQNLGKNVLPHMKAEKDIIAWDFVSRYFYPHLIAANERNQVSPTIVDMGTAKCLPAGLKIGAADLGTVAYRLAFLKQHKLHIYYPDGTYNGLSDGYFIEQAAKLTNASVILRQTLYIHQ